MKEAGVIIDVLGNPIFWHTPDDRTVGSLPDSVTLWSVLWEANKLYQRSPIEHGALLGFAHTHPGRDHHPSPSMEDITTFEAVERALGRPLHWWIFNETHGIFLSKSPGRVPRLDHYHIEPFEDRFMTSWVYQLRKNSNY